MYPYLCRNQARLLLVKNSISPQCLLLRRPLAVCPCSVCTPCTSLMVKLPVRQFSIEARRCYPRYAKTPEAVNQITRDRYQLLIDRAEQSPAALAQVALERDSGNVTADDHKLLEAIDHSTATYKDYIRICLSRFRTCLAYQMTLKDITPFVSGYVHPKSKEGRARIATAMLFISAYGWFRKAYEIALRDESDIVSQIAEMAQILEHTMEILSKWFENDSTLQRNYQAWPEIAEHLVWCSHNCGQLWHQDFGDFEPHIIVPEAEALMDEDKEQELMDGMDRIWEEVKAGPRKMRKEKGTKTKGDLGFSDDGIDGAVETNPVQKVKEEEDEFLQAWRSFLQVHLWDKKIRPKDPDRPKR